jgi:alpha-tubulin suppressor-like RCC1 family protein
MLPLYVDAVAPATRPAEYYTCAIRWPEKVVLCWGNNYLGALGRATFTFPLADQAKPSPVCTAASECPALTASALGVSSHACAISADSVRCWGGNDHGQLGDGSLNNRSFASSNVATAASVSALAVGESHSCALLADGRVQCWGDKVGLGNNATEDSRVPVAPSW